LLVGRSQGCKFQESKLEKREPTRDSGWVFPTCQACRVAFWLGGPWAHGPLAPTTLAPGAWEVLQWKQPPFRIHAKSERNPQFGPLEHSSCLQAATLQNLGGVSARFLAFHLVPRAATWLAGAVSALHPRYPIPASKTPIASDRTALPLTLPGALPRPIICAFARCMVAPLNPLRHGGQEGAPEDKLRFVFLSLNRLWPCSKPRTGGEARRSQGAARQWMARRSAWDENWELRICGRMHTPTPPISHHPQTSDGGPGHILLTSLCASSP
jgi:hypothetical protein